MPKWHRQAARSKSWWGQPEGLCYIAIIVESMQERYNKMVGTQRQIGRAARKKN